MIVSAYLATQRDHLPIITQYSRDRQQDSEGTRVTGRENSFETMIGCLEQDLSMAPLDSKCRQSFTS